MPLDLLAGSMGPNWPLCRRLCPIRRVPAAFSRLEDALGILRKRWHQNIHAGEPEVTGQRMRINASRWRAFGAEAARSCFCTVKRPCQVVFCNPLAAMVYKKRRDFYGVKFD